MRELEICEFKSLNIKKKKKSLLYISRKSIGYGVI